MGQARIKFRGGDNRCVGAIRHGYGADRGARAVNRGYKVNYGSSHTVDAVIVQGHGGVGKGVG